MIRWFSRRRRVSIVLALVAAALIAYVVELPLSVDAYARIVPRRTWVLAKTDNGRLIATLNDHIAGACNSYVIHDVTGNAHASFTLNQAALSGDDISAGDTLGFVYSSDVEERLIGLRGELAVAEAALSVCVTGEKEAEISRAEQELRLARAESQQQQKVQARLEALYHKDLVSQLEYEIGATETRVRELEIAVAAANVTAAETGAKPEEVHEALTRKESIQAEIDAILRQLAASTVVSPITGTVSRASGPDTILCVYEASDYLALIAIQAEDCPWIIRAGSGDVSWKCALQEGSARLLALDQEVRLLGSRRVVMATAIVDGPDAGLLPGTVVKCTVPCGSMTVWEHIERLFGRAA